MSKAIMIVGLLAVALCFCCCLLMGGGLYAFSGPSPAPAPSPPASGSSRSSGSGSSGSGSDDSDDSDDGEPEASESSTNNQASSVEEEDGHPVTTNGRCGPGSDGRDQRCGGKACCSQWNWCGGERGSASAWCHGSNDVDGPIGHWGGQYDGTD